MLALNALQVSQITLMPNVPQDAKRNKPPNKRPPPTRTSPHPLISKLIIKVGITHWRSKTKFKFKKWLQIS